uniref:G-protein coupled receptor 52-like n=1 Tax=Myxine glutinosa TaxID=7769 RepID=UPI00358F5388
MVGFRSRPAVDLSLAFQGPLMNLDAHISAAMNLSTAMPWTEAEDGRNGTILPFSCPLGLRAAGVRDVCVLEAIVIGILTALIVVGNLTVIAVFHCISLLHHRNTSYFVQTMAYADLAVGASCVLPALSLFRVPLVDLHEALACQVFGYAICVLKSVSMACLAGIGLDRYVAIRHPLSYNQLVTPCRLRVSIIAIWLYSCAVFAPCFLGWGKPGYHGDVFQWCAQAWQTHAPFSAFLVAAVYAPAALAVCFAYFHIFRVCRQHTREINERRARFPSQDTDTSQEATTAAAMAAAYAMPVPSAESRHYALVLFRITGVFYLLWLPYITYFLLESARVAESSLISFVTTWLATSNSFCNCLVYSLSSGTFRHGLRRLSETASSRCTRHFRLPGAVATGTATAANAAVATAQRPMRPKPLGHRRRSCSV